MGSPAFLPVPSIGGIANSLSRSAFLIARATQRPRRRRLAAAPPVAALTVPEASAKPDQSVEAPAVRFAEASGVGGDDIGLPLEYDDAIIGAYWGERQGAAMKRLGEVIAYFSPWVLRVALDASRGILRKNSAARAAELREILTALGPTS